MNEEIELGRSDFGELDDLRPSEVLTFGICWTEWRGCGVECLESRVQRDSPI